MENKQPSSDYSCQRDELTHSGEGLGLIDLARNLFLRLLSAFNRRIFKRDKRMLPVSGQPHFGHFEDESDSDKPTSSPTGKAKESFKEGDLVEILSWEEIKATLDENYCLKGLAFMEGMQKYCRQRARVMKKVRTVFDEHSRKMVRVRRAYILEGVICDGRDAYFMEGCDKCCFFFWKDQWLRKVGE